MKEFWGPDSRLLAALLVFCLYLLNLSLCWSLNDEGVALLRIKEKVVSDPHGALSNWNDEARVESPCSWFGVECSGGYVVALNLKDLCLRGTLAPDVGELVHVKSIILRNNSFSGVIPEEIANLRELEVLDLGYNNFSGQVSCRFGNNLSMLLLLLDNNELLDSRDPEIYELQKLSEAQVEEDLLSSTKRPSSCNELIISRNSLQTGDGVTRKLLQEPPFARRPAFSFFPLFPPPESIVRNEPPPPTLIPDPEPDPAEDPFTPAPAPDPNLSPVPSTGPSTSNPSPSPANPISPSSLPTPAAGPQAPAQHSRRHHNRLLIVSAASGGPLLLLVIIGIFFWQSGKVATVKPWATGLSGQLQRAFVTGVPKLKRSELEAACEDFSNVIGSSSLCTLYKGTLSSGVEIAVASISVASAKDWSNSQEAQFRKKIDTLSKVNYKNFVGLLGYCVEEEPFTRMMVFEYAPNGTLFEHLHIKEAEHLDWATRLRVAMGMAYCLQHMHQLTPALAHRNFNSSAVYLTDDYAAKVSDLAFSNDGSSSDNDPNIQNNVYSFGIVLFEMITGKLPYSAGSDSSDDWASDYYLSGAQPLREMVDPTLETFQEDQLQLLDSVIKSCVNPDPRRRPTMVEVCARLREITGIDPDGAAPKVSPLWWAELEILSTEAS
ncbi:inactive receptor-like serine/threonine-protein kinase At2g40270 [Sesamum indicum]|uniref:Inactive receptor-like serine/threonine-protein kinase At2g40270 n=1 Tax=Sesamum indicum TaxID=4182 RepID=A0A6I9TIA3_SESIN|nr:inactive receptor-like serine/threonine-protein kinase At2g40270 [Sesamum indicum]